MLIYVDAPKIIKVYREENEAHDGPRRTRIGFIQKSTFEVRPGPQATISSDETAEIHTVIDRYKSAIDAQKRADILRFPEIARSVAEYYGERATDVEKRLISIALVETMRAIRRADRGEAQSAVTSDDSPAPATESDKARPSRLQRQR